MTSPAARRFGKNIKRQQQSAEQPTISAVNTTVAAVTAGTSLDGRYSVTVVLNADTVPAPYLAAYINGHTPTVGDQVRVQLTDGSPLILDRIFGFPTI